MPVKHDRVRGQNGTKGKLFTFLFGIVVGTVVASLIFANYYASIFIQQSAIQNVQVNHLDSPQVRKKQLRNEQSSSSTIDDKDPLQITNDTADHQKTRTQATKTTPSSIEIRTNESSASQCDDIEEPSFLKLAKQTGTDKVKGIAYLPSCLEDDSTCTRPSCEREKCRPWGHFYQTMYQQKLSKFLDPKESFQLMEIGYVSIFIASSRQHCH